MNKLYKVKFGVAVAPWMPGELASFSLDLAKHYVSKGVAEFDPPLEEQDKKLKSAGKKPNRMINTD